MINLLPTGSKEEMFYARKNTRLFKWLTTLLFSLAGVVLLVLAGNLYLQLSINNYTSEAERAQQELDSQQIDETQAQIEDLSASTKLATDVLSREILFSKLLRQLGASIPNNTVLQQFQVEEFGGDLALQAAATDINSATQLQVNLEDPQNKIFKKADIESISCDESAENTRYPCSIQLRALFADDNPYTFIGQSSGGRQ